MKIKGILTPSDKRGSSTGASISVGKLIENLHGFKEPSKVSLSMSKYTILHSLSYKHLFGMNEILFDTLSQVDSETGIDGEIDDKKLFFTQYLERLHIKIFLSPLDPSTWKVFMTGYTPPVLITLVCSFMRALFVPIDHHDQVIPINHTNVIDIGYWSSVKGLDVYCSAGTETT